MRRSYSIMVIFNWLIILPVNIAVKIGCGKTYLALQKQGWSQCLEVKILCILVPRGHDPFGQHQESIPLASPNFWACAENTFYNFQPIRFVRFDNESVNRGLPVLGAARGLDFWCWPKGSWPLGTRIFSLKCVKKISKVSTALCDQSYSVMVILNWLIILPVNTAMKFACAKTYLALQKQGWSQCLEVKILCILVPRGHDPFGQHQESIPLASPNFWACAENTFYNFQPIRFVRFDNESVNRGLPVLGTTRGLDFWCWPKGSWPVGTRINIMLLKIAISYLKVMSQGEILNDYWKRLLVHVTQDSF